MFSKQVQYFPFTQSSSAYTAAEERQKYRNIVTFDQA